MLDNEKRPTGGSAW